MSCLRVINAAKRPHLLRVQGALGGEVADWIWGYVIPVQKEREGKCITDASPPLRLFVLSRVIHWIILSKFAMTLNIFMRVLARIQEMDFIIVIFFYFFMSGYNLYQPRKFAMSDREQQVPNFSIFVSNYGSVEERGICVHYSRGPQWPLGVKRMKRREGGGGVFGNGTDELGDQVEWRKSKQTHRQTHRQEGRQTDITAGR